jgi:hypothetical protein
LKLRRDIEAVEAGIESCCSSDDLQPLGLAWAAAAEPDMAFRHVYGRLDT